MRLSTWVPITLTALATATVLSACATTPAAAPTSPAASVTPASSPEASAAVHNAADTSFAQMMIIHHQGAIDMAELAVEKADNPEVKALGERISAAQGPEIDLMSSWLNEWGEDPAPEMSGMPGMDHSGMEMDGMSQEQVMAELDGLSGVEFDRQFLTSMIAHHEGAISMAQTQLTGGQNPEALALAEKIIQDQQAEIEEMRQLLAAL